MDIELKEVHVGKIIKERLFKLDMKKIDFAKKIGIPQQHVNRILERDTMETKRLVEVCRALDINIFAKFCVLRNHVTSHYSAVSIGGEGDVVCNIGGDAAIAELEKKKIEVKFLEERIASLVNSVSEKEERCHLYEKQVETYERLLAANERMLEMYKNKIENDNK
jgi:DNA-binding Xre family transcriptional regulator